MFIFEVWDSFHLKKWHVPNPNVTNCKQIAASVRSMWITWCSFALISCSCTRIMFNYFESLSLSKRFSYPNWDRQAQRLGWTFISATCGRVTVFLSCSEVAKQWGDLSQLKIWGWVRDGQKEAGWSSGYCPHSGGMVQFSWAFQVTWAIAGVQEDYL